MAFAAFCRPCAAIWLVPLSRRPLFCEFLCPIVLLRYICRAHQEFILRGDYITLAIRQAFRRLLKVMGRLFSPHTIRHHGYFTLRPVLQPYRGPTRPQGQLTLWTQLKYLTHLDQPPPARSPSSTGGARFPAPREAARHPCTASEGRPAMHSPLIHTTHKHYIYTPKTNHT